MFQEINKVVKGICDVNIDVKKGGHVLTGNFD